ncbi:Sec34-like family protein [Metarhizium album ARSEF 1941]|uniref:Conserved oligomeric Golgi complex subunit 3 n=1 Tax=Metarhizium album (strain ARSEF 1941) TaxID=1081103 RepID=A0A0B2WXJ6_METAS|nr:Sec34-like family protein [Metarhizium album ARSEF 1941]KHO01012.1 Sec34-like family protein [Metarhizium album ARSEF 1941]
MIVRSCGPCAPTINAAAAATDGQILRLLQQVTTVTSPITQQHGAHHDWPAHCKGAGRPLVRWLLGGRSNCFRLQAFRAANWPVDHMRSDEIEQPTLSSRHFTARFVRASARHVRRLVVQLCARSIEEACCTGSLPKSPTKGVSSSAAKCWCSLPAHVLVVELVVVHQNSLQLSQGDVKEERTGRLENVFEEPEDSDTPPEPTVIRRAASYTDFYHVFRAQLTKDGQLRRKKKPDKKDKAWEVLLLAGGDEPDQKYSTPEPLDQAFEKRLLEESQLEYLLYCDQLTLTERHLDGLISDADAALTLLTSLSDSFQSVDAQTTTFQARCEGLLKEQKRLEALANEVGTDLHYYLYLDTATRRLNAPGASRLVDGDEFGEIIDTIDSCIDFMNRHETYRERDTYLARYSALLTKALHLLDHGFSTRLDKLSSEIARQIVGATSDSARHALAYGRFAEMITDTYSLLPNVQRVVRHAYDQYGRALESSTETAVYADSTTNMFRTYLNTRDRDLKAITQRDLEEYQKAVKSLSVETASRNYIKQLFERIHHEDALFLKIFGIEPTWNTATTSAFQALKGINTAMVHPCHIAPLGSNIQSVLQTAKLESVCSVVGWLANEYSVSEQDEEESQSERKHREYAARLLVDHLWPFTDNAFDAEITRSISKATLHDGDLKIGPVVDGVASSNAYPLVKKAVELLSKFDQAIPKERSSKNSAVVFKIVRETIRVLQRAEARIQSLKSSTDPDLFMVKNLLIVKNELVSLEIGDIRSHPQSMQHFGQIWDTLSPANWLSFFGSILGGSIWSRGTPSVTAKTLTAEDMGEQLDELLRQSIYAFTKRWATLINDSANRKPGVKPIAKIEAELESILDTAFSNQPEVIAKLKEAIKLNAQAQNDAKDEKRGVKRY